MIPTTISSLDIYAFDKIDGSNIRAEWSKKRGFYKFGTRHRMLGIDDPIFGEAIGLIQNNFEKDIDGVMRKAQEDNGVFFFEFFGDNSFAGLHQEEPHRVILFDVNLHKQGMLPPKEYLKLFGHLDIANMLYYGKQNSDFIEQVRNGTLPGMTYEGVVCKASHPSKPGVLMFKIKNQAWHQALRDRCNGDEKLYAELE